LHDRKVAARLGPEFDLRARVFRSEFDKDLPAALRSGSHRAFGGVRARKPAPDHAGRCMRVGRPVKTSESIGAVLESGRDADYRCFTKLFEETRGERMYGPPETLVLLRGQLALGAQC